MQGRYAFIVPFGANKAQEAPSMVSSTPELRHLSSRDGWHCFVSPDLRLPWRSEGDFGVLGTTFRRGAPAIASTDGQSSVGEQNLLASWWGAYVAIQATESGAVRILRDPSAHLPCYYTKGKTAWIAASDIDLLTKLSGQRPSINWNELADELVFPGHFGRRTALDHVSELLPGEVLVLSEEDATIEQAWHPATYARHCPAADGMEAASRLSAALVEVHEKLATIYNSPLITVSGGLDSAIVAGSFVQHSGKGNFLNLRTDDATGDERHYARQVAEACDRHLDEREYVAPSLNSCLESQAHLPRPTSRFIGSSINSVLLDVARRGDHPAILSGYGGDNVFCSLSSSVPLSDRARSGGSLRNLRSTAADLRVITGASTLQLINHALRDARRTKTRNGRGNWGKNTNFLSDDLGRIEYPAAPHPWLTSTEGVLSGKSAHIRAIIRAHTFLERFPRSEPVAHLSPLLFAPILETCLAIPTWLWCEGGIDRAVARRAATFIPSAIAQRRSKGTPITMHTRFYEDNRRALGDFLLNGHLVRKGLVSGASIHRYIEKPLPARDLDYLRLLEIVDAEVWCDRWSG